MAFKRDEAYEEQGKFVARVIASIFWSILIAWLGILIFLPMTSWFINGFGVEQLSGAMGFWKNASFNPTVLYDYFKSYKRLISVQQISTPVVYLPYLSFILAFVFLVYRISTNPYNYRPNVFGSGRKATYADIEKMGLFKGFVIVLGRFKGKLLQMPETLSALVVAPPGTGKTAGVVIPTILESPGLSLIVNDPKPELCYNTTGYRATQGPVFVIKT